MKKTHVVVTGQEALNQHSWNYYCYFKVDRGDGELRKIGRERGWENSSKVLSSEKALAAVRVEEDGRIGVFWSLDENTLEFDHVSGT